MTYTQTLDYLYAKLPMFHRIGDLAYKKDIINTIKLCAILDNPQDSLKIIHVAGTNGKGSTSHLVSSMLQEMGYRVGLYTSPHYIDFRERIKINGELISEQEIISFVEQIEPNIEEIHPSFFEVTVALAFDYFKRQKVDFAVIEVGLGGRLDSTNIVNPIISVITNIGFDHMFYLGNTLPEIAAEKAGIIKNNIPVVIGESKVETAKVFLETALKHNATIVFADKNIQINVLENSGVLKKMNLEISDIDLIVQVETGLMANYQEANIKTALQTILTIQSYFTTSIPLKTVIQNGIKNINRNTYFIGRWMVMQQNPLVIFDSAHNEHGLKPVFHQISKLNYGQLHIIFGTVADKELDLLFPILPKNGIYYFVAANIPRAMKSIQVKEFFSAMGMMGNAYNSVIEGYTMAMQKAKINDIVMVIGSIFVLGELLEQLDFTLNENRADDHYGNN